MCVTSANRTAVQLYVQFCYGNLFVNSKTKTWRPYEKVRLVFSLTGDRGAHTFSMKTLLRTLLHIMYEILLAREQIQTWLL
jgi:hypothetical protein